MWFVIHEINKNGSTGKKLMVVNANSKTEAAKIYYHNRKSPSKVRVFEGKAMKKSGYTQKYFGRKMRKQTHERQEGFGGINVKMPRLF